MAIKHYKGTMGEFDYDDKEFEIVTDKSIFGNCLFNEDAKRYAIKKGLFHYTGKETDGSKIHIPNGIKDCSYMFYGCEFLKTAPIIPKGVKVCDYMFEYCENLETPSIIPEGVTDCCAMFQSCYRLETPPIIPEGVTDCEYMFYECGELKTAPIIPETVKNCRGMFCDCHSLKIAPKVPESVEHYDGFCGCHIFDGYCDCADEGKWNLEHRGQSLTEVMNNIIDTYSLPDKLKNAKTDTKIEVVDFITKYETSGKNKAYDVILSDIKSTKEIDPSLLKKYVDITQNRIDAETKYDEMVKSMQHKNRSVQVSAEFGDIQSNSSELQSECS